MASQSINKGDIFSNKNMLQKAWKWYFAFKMGFSFWKKQENRLKKNELINI